MIAAVATAIQAANNTGLGEIFSHPFMRNAFLAGTPIAIASGLVGYFLVLRGQVFSGDALSHVAIPGALGALMLGVDARLGLFVVTIAVGLLMGVLGRRGSPDEVVIGVVFTAILGLGALLMSLSSRRSGGTDGSANVSVLFGSIFGLSADQTLVAAVVGVVICAAIVWLARPLLFASVDEAVASGRGVPVRALGVGFLGLVGLCAAEAAQVVGSLLLLGLLTAPAGAARLLTDRPWRGLFLAAVTATVAMWGGLVLSYLVGRVPPSFSIIALAAAIYLGASIGTTFRIAPARRAGRIGRP